MTILYPITIVRNSSVFCLNSLIRNDYPNFRSDIKKMKSGLITQESLSENLLRLFGENKTYAEMKELYYSLMKGEENEEFSFGYSVDRSHVIVINEDKDILLYYYQDFLRVAKQPLFPWEYPDSISKIGNSLGFSTEEVLSDFQILSFLDFFIKYNVKPNHLLKDHSIAHDNNTYIVDDYLTIAIDSHVNFHYSTTEEYISDVWWYDDEEIIRDITTMTLLQYGKKYTGYWGR